MSLQEIIDLNLGITKKSLMKDDTPQTLCETFNDTFFDVQIALTENESQLCEIYSIRSEARKNQKDFEKKLFGKFCAYFGFSNNPLNDVNSNEKIQNYVDSNETVRLKIGLAQSSFCFF